MSASRRSALALTPLSLLTFLLVGCSAGEEQRLRAQIGSFVAAAAEQQGECAYASGFVEKADPSLRCWFLVRGAVDNVAATIERRLRDAGMRVEVKPGAGPSARLLFGHEEAAVVHLALIAERRFLFFQARRLPVPVDLTGIDITLTRTD